MGRASTGWGEWREEQLGWAVRSGLVFKVDRVSLDLKWELVPKRGTLLSTQSNRSRQNLVPGLRLGSVGFGRS